MLQVISIESPSPKVTDFLYSWLKKKMDREDSREKKTNGDGDLLFFYWEKTGVVMVDEEQPTKFSAKKLLEAVEELEKFPFQLWTRLPLNEGTLRSLRKLHDSGKIQFRCFLLSSKQEENDDLPSQKELERIVKISQNRPLGAEWVSVSGQEEIGSFLDGVLSSRNGLAYPIPTLPKVTSADIDPLVETPLSRMMRRYYSAEKGRAIHWYPKKYVHKAMDEEKWGVDPLPKNKQGSVKRHVLVTGTGRSGTTYFSDLLTLLGLDVGHQRNGKDGCSGAEFALDHDWYPWFPVYGGGDCANVGERRSDYDYKHVLHIVRHPLWCIPSLMRNYPAINPEFWADNGTMDPRVMDGSSILRNATMYYNINRVIDESGQAEYRCQLEKIHEHWSTLMDILEMSGTPDPELGATNKAVGWGQYEPLTWSQLENEVGSFLTGKIRQQAKSYGYE